MRQVAPENYNRQLMDTTNVYPWNASRCTAAATTCMPLPRHATTTEAAESSAQIVEIEETVDTPSEEAQQELTLRTNTQQTPRQPALELEMD